MKKQLIILATLAIISTLSYAQTVDEIIKKNIGAVGGADKINAVRTLQYDQTMRMMGMTMPSKISIITGKSYRNDMSMTAGKLTQAIDGDKGWATSIRQGVSTPQKLTDNQVNMLKSNIYVPGTELATVKSKNYSIKLVGKEKLNDKDVFKLEVVKPEGKANFYVDASTYLLSGMQTYVSNQGQSSELNVNLKGEMKLMYADYKVVEGLLIPTSLELNSPGIPDTATLTISNVVVNPKIDPSFLKCQNNPIKPCLRRHLATIVGVSL